MKKKIAIIGSGEHANVIRNSITTEDRYFIGFIGPDKGNENNSDCLGSDEVLPYLLTKNPGIKFILGIGNIVLREKILRQSYSSVPYLNVLDFRAIIANNITLGNGIFIAAGAIVQFNAKIGNHCIINTGAIIEHDCSIGQNTHIAPGAILGGGCIVGNNCLIGLGVTVKDHITIGNNVVVGAGAVVIDNIESNQVFAGVPAKEIKNG